MHLCRIAAAALLALAFTAAQATNPLPITNWQPPTISTPQWESHPAIDPLTGDVWFVRSDTHFAGWRLWVSHCASGTLQPAIEVALAGEGLEADPFFADSGKTLWFISTGPGASKNSADLDIWRVARNPDNTWGKPERLPAPLNSNTSEWFPRPAHDGWLYFGSRREGGKGADDIWRARKHGDTWQVENAGAAFNTKMAEYEFQPSPDGTWGALSTDNGLYRLDHGAKGWKPRVRYGAEINVTSAEIGPMIASDGQSIVFSRDAGDGKSGELYIAGPMASKGIATCGAR